MADENDKHPAYHDWSLATMYRLDPDKLAALRRSMTGTTRCPQCDELNRADQKRCGKCGAKLYPGMEDDEEGRKDEEPYEEPLNEAKKKDKTGDSSKPPFG